MQNLLRSTALSLLFSSALVSTAYAAPGQTIDGSSPTVSVGTVSGTAGDTGILFDTNDTPVDVTVTGTVTGDGTAAGINMLGNEDNNITLTIEQTGTVQGGNSTGFFTGQGIYGAGNDNLSLTINGIVNGGDGTDGVDDAVNPTEGQPAGHGIRLNSGANGSVIVNGTVQGGVGGDGGDFLGANGDGWRGNFGGAGIIFGLTNSTLQVNDGSAIRGGASGESGQANGTGDVISSRSGGVGVSLSGDDSDLIMSGGQILGGDQSTAGSTDSNGGAAVGISGSNNELIMTGGFIRGGQGADANGIYNAQDGGAGVSVSGPGFAENTLIDISGGAFIEGGNAGLAGSFSPTAQGGAGILAEGGDLTVRIGTGSFVRGGQGAAFASPVINGGVGILYDGTGSLTVVNDGRIENGFHTFGSDESLPDAIQILGGSGHDISNNGVIEYESIDAAGIELDADTTTINNLGTIRDDDPSEAGGTGILTRGNGITLDNLINSGTISTSGGRAVHLQSGDTISLLNNSGTMESTLTTGSQADAITLDISGSMTNLINNGGTISSAGNAAIQVDGGSINNFQNINDGLINTASTSVAQGAIVLDNGGSVTNLIADGTIRADAAGQAALYFTDDAGTIASFNSLGTLTAGASGRAVDNTQSGAVGGILSFANTGDITGDIVQQADHAYQFEMNAGSMNGSVTLDATTGNTVTVNGGTINGNIGFVPGAGSNTITINGGTVNGTIFTNIGNNGETVTANNATAFAAAIGQGQTSAVSGAAPRLIKNNTGTLTLYADIEDTSGSNRDALLEINNGRVLISDTAMQIQGQVDHNAGVFDLTNSMVTVDNNIDIANGAVLETLINSTTDYGQIVGSTLHNITMTVNDGAVIDISDGSVLSGNQSYTLIDNTGFGASTLTVDPSQLTIQENNARVDIAASQVGQTLVLTTSLDQTGLDAQERQINEQLDPAFAGDTELVTALGGLTTQQLQTTLETVTPDTSGGDKMGSYLIYQGLSDLVLSQGGGVSGVSAGESFTSYAQKRKPRAWIEAFGQIADQDDKSGRNGYEATTGGLAAGMDVLVDDLLGDRTRLGLSYGYGSGEIDINNAQDETDIKTHQVIAYGQTKAGDLTFDLQLGYGFNNYESSRHVIVGAVERQAAADFDGHQFTARVDVSKPKMLERGIELTPTLGAEIYHLETDSYAETGAGSANLNVEDQDYTRVTAHLGAKAEKDFTLENGTVLTPSFKLGYSYDVMDDDISTTAQFSGGGGSFITKGIEMDRSSLRLGAGLTVMQAQNLEFSVNYDADIRDSYTAHNGKINLRYLF